MHRICKWENLPPPREENMWQPACVCLTTQTRVITADIFALSQAEVTICEKMSFSLINVRRSVNTQQDNKTLFSSTCMLSFISTDMNEAAGTEQSQRIKPQTFHFSAIFHTEFKQIRYVCNYLTVGDAVKWVLLHLAFGV